MNALEVGPIRTNERVSADMYRLVAELPRLAQTTRPGQFLHVRTARGWDPLLRRPFSPSRVDRENGLVEMVYRVVGRGTELMTQMRAGDEIDVLGPRGTTFTLDGKMLMVGGGVGIAPILFAAQQAAAGTATVVIGGRSREELFWQDYFPDTINDLLLTTDDGSVGHHGYAVDLVPALLASGEFDRVLCCGPTILMSKVAAAAYAAGVPCEVSFERRMGCGTGGCYACVCDRKDGTHAKVCQEGPVFDRREVIL